MDGFVGDTTVLRAVLNQDLSCSLSLMDRDFLVGPVGFLSRKGWPWAEDFKLHVLRMIEIKRQEDTWKIKNKPLICNGPSQPNPQLSIADMSGIFLVIGFTIVYCCFCLIVKNIYSLLVHRYRNSNNRWNVPNAY